MKVLYETFSKSPSETGDLPLFLFSTSGMQMWWLQRWEPTWMIKTEVTTTFLWTGITRSLILDGFMEPPYQPWAANLWTSFMWETLWVSILCFYFEFLLLKAQLILTAVVGPYSLRTQVDALNHYEALFLQIKVKLRGKYIENPSSSSKWRCDATILSSPLLSPGLYAWCTQPVLNESEKLGSY